MSAQDSELSIGQQLIAARQALDLSVAEVAQKINLKESQINDFENDIFILENIPSVFVRGYLRKYVLFLKLPESLLTSVDYGDVAPKYIVPPRTGKQLSAAPKARWLKVFTWGILLVAIGMTFTWWWEEHQKELASREAYVAQHQSHEKPNSLKDEKPVYLWKTSEISVSPLVVLEPAKIEETTPVLSEPTASPLSTENAIEQNTSTITDELYIEIHTEESWISVQNVHKKRLAEALYRQGDTIRLNDNEFYSLTIGAPANVNIYYKGQQVPLKVDGRVARIKLPQ